MDWLREHHPDHFFAICDAEEEIRALEWTGSAEGQKYEEACQKLARRFEEGRRLKLRETVKVWIQ
jgi:hypothetical protein